jgi:2-methylcitrate dehydratase PrpD
MGAAIKKWCVGSPIQAALDSLMVLITDHGIGPGDVARMRVIMPDDRLHIVDDRDMPDVCLQHLLAVCLIDGGVGFAAAHDRGRMSDAAVRSLRSRIKAIPSKELTEARPPRQAIVEVDTHDGRSLRHHTRAVLGTPANPMTRAQVVAKARDLIVPELGDFRTDALIASVLSISDMADVRDLRPLLVAGA